MDVTRCAFLFLVLLTACGRDAPVRNGGGADAEPTGSPSPSPSSLRDNDSWSPATYREDGRLVMPVTFPDRTQAELVYPPELGLEDLHVYPDTYVTGSEACGPALYATRHDLEGWITGKEPLDEHVRPDGMRVELWEGAPSSRPYEFLVYRFGDWTAFTPCLEIVDRDHVRIWAENLHGEQSPDGMLVLESTPPLVVNPWHDRDAPTIRMSDDDIIIDLRTARCDTGSGGDRGADDGVIQWCIHPQGGIYLYANGFSPAAERFLQDLVEGLEVRRVRPPEG
jgi:hypothetical protein